MPSDLDLGVTVTGYGEATTTPDVLRVVLTVGCHSEDVSTAMRDAAVRTEAVTTVLRELGLGDRGLRTSGLGVRQRHSRQGAAAGYRASHTLAVTCRDISLGGRLLSAAAAAAGNDLSVDHVGLDVADRGPVMEQARELAFHDARSRAQQYAVLAGRELGEVHKIDEATSSAPPAPRGGMQMMAAESADIGVETGESTFGAAVTVTWGWA